MVNDYLVVVAGVNAFLAPYSDRIEMVEKDLVSSGSATVDVALYDSFASSLGKDDRLEKLLQDPTIAAVAVYSFTSDPAAVRDSLDAGAHGFLSKSLTAPELVSGIEQIAEQCYLSLNTVKTYVRSAYRKMDVATRAQAVAWGIENGLKPDR